MQKLIPTEDKLKHLYVGQIISTVSFLMLFLIHVIFDVSPYIMTLTFVPSLGAGIYKEVRDKNGTGTPEKMDVFFTALTGITKSLMITLILYFSC